MMVEELTISTTAVEEMIDITRAVQGVVDRSGIHDGICHVFVPHTTAGVTINEHADPDVASDLIDASRDLVPTARDWRHAEGNSPAHVKASLIGAGQLIGITDGKLDLGVWQGVFLWEFDGPRMRRLRVRILS